MSAQDPAVRTWGESLAASADQAASTSALLRRLTDELDDLRDQYNAVLLERDAIAAHLREALDGNTALAMEHAAALLAIDRLTRSRDEFARAASEQLKLRKAAEAEVERLTEKYAATPTARHARTYQLTPDGLAVLEAMKEQP